MRVCACVYMCGVFVVSCMIMLYVICAFLIFVVLVCQTHTRSYLVEIFGFLF